MFIFVFIFDNVLEIIVYIPFIMECLKELWNGVDLLSRVRIKFLHEENRFKNQMELNIHPYSGFFPISHKNITSLILVFLVLVYEIDISELLHRMLKEMMKMVCIEILLMSHLHFICGTV
uniref:Uncharacterized protein n=1 Tax=Lactuca sativa TaxID=4236 RepID=A0A9R1VUH6_LACSA|nr:hypothetical protein LSAT_V11C400181310 [Lactuca sativa]